MTQHQRLAVSVTGLADFWKFLDTNNLSKVAQMFDDILGYSESVTFYIQTALAVFWATFGGICTTF